MSIKVLPKKLTERVEMACVSHYYVDDEIPEHLFLEFKYPSDRKGRCEVRVYEMIGGISHRSQGPLLQVANYQIEQLEIVIHIGKRSKVSVRFYEGCRLGVYKIIK